MATAEWLSIDSNADFTSFSDPPPPLTKRKKERNQPFTHVPRNGPDLRGGSKGQRTAFQKPHWRRDRVTTGEIKHEGGGKAVKGKGRRV